MEYQTVELGEYRMQENRSTLPEPLKAVVSMIEEIRRTTREAETRVKGLDIVLSKLEAELERQLSVQERTTREMQKLRNELETLKASAAAREQAIAAARKQAPAGEPAGSEAERTRTAAPVQPAPGIPEQPAAEKQPEKSRNAGLPVMPGSGFSHITYDYLKKIAQK
jgi:chromosome segregation ATPase